MGVRVAPAAARRRAHIIGHLLGLLRRRTRRRFGRRAGRAGGAVHWRRGGAEWVTWRRRSEAARGGRPSGCRSETEERQRRSLSLCLLVPVLENLAAVSRCPFFRARMQPRVPRNSATVFGHVGGAGRRLARQRGARDAGGRFGSGRGEWRAAGGDRFARAWRGSLNVNVVC
jgi:hypothetical protein